MKFDGLLLCLSWAIFTSYSNTTIISSFFPQYALQEFDINESYIGLIFGISSLSSFFASLILGKIMTKYGIKKNLQILGITIQGISSGLFIFLQYLENRIAFILLSILLRLALGLGIGFLLTPTYSYLPIFYEEKLEFIISLFELMVGLGLSLGPLFGGILYEHFGFSGSYYFCIIMSFALVPLQIAFIPPDQIKDLINPDKLNEKNQQNLQNEQNQQKQQQQQLAQNKISIKDEEQATPQQQQQNQNDSSKICQIVEVDNMVEYQINYTQIFSNIHIIFIFCLFSFPVYISSYLDPTLGPYAEEQYQLSSQDIGFVFFIGAIVYVIFLPLGAYVSKKQKKYRQILTTGCFFVGLSMYIIAPSLHIPKNRWFLYIGEAVFNLANAFVYIPILPAFVEVLTVMYPSYSQEILGDISSALLNSALAVGQLIGPSLGGIVVSYIGFPTASVYFGSPLIIISIIYFFVMKFKKLDDKSNHLQKQQQFQTSSNKKQIAIKRSYNFVSYNKQLSEILPQFKQQNSQSEQDVYQFLRDQDILETSKGQAIVIKKFSHYKSSYKIENNNSNNKYHESEKKKIENSSIINIEQHLLNEEND